jgi:hypothetical protein
MLRLDLDFAPTAPAPVHIPCAFKPNVFCDWHCQAVGEEPLALIEGQISCKAFLYILCNIKYFKALLPHLAAAALQLSCSRCSMQPLPESYAALIATDALRAWQPSADVFADCQQQQQAPLCDATNRPTSSSAHGRPSESPVRWAFLDGLYIIRFRPQLAIMCLYAVAGTCASWPGGQEGCLDD